MEIKKKKLQMDSIMLVLQLAMEAYRVRLDPCNSLVIAGAAAAADPLDLASAGPSSGGGASCDLNHNKLSDADEMEAIRRDIRHELVKTEHLIKCLYRRSAYCRDQSYDLATMRQVLNDVKEGTYHSIFTFLYHPILFNFFFK